MYAIRTTPGFIIDSRAYGEAGKLVSIFTRDLGLVMATAVGIRFERSKLRYFAQDYSFGSFSLVRGREFWRLTSAAGFTDGSRETASQALMARIALILRRLLQGEEPNAGLFECVEHAARFIHSGQPQALDEERSKTLESLTVIRIMHRLGYIGDAIDLNGYVVSSELSPVLLDELKEKRISMNRHINKALKESHL